MPTRNARNGTLFTTRGKLNIKNASLRASREPIDAGLETYASQNFSLGYLRHLFVAGEILALQLATAQNLSFYLWLVRTARQKILEGEYRHWYQSFLEEFYPE
jgi:queuine tRNA-ribosyltransferase